MSQWTHVNASIRFDSIMGLKAPTEKELGRICRWADEDTSHWDNPDLPCGSEGSIEYKIIQNPDESCMAAFVVVFWGDLRDYDNVDEVIAYFDRITKDKMIRQGVLEISVEYQQSKVYVFDNEKEEWVNLI